MSLSLSLTLSTTASSEGAASDDGHQRPYDILTTFVVAGGSKDAETRWKSKKERIVLHSVGQLSFRLRSIRRVRDPLRSLLPCSFYHLQGSGNYLCYAPHYLRKNVSALSACQDKMGTGYLSAFPPEQFDRFEAIKPVWAPYYTIHKILAGLLDQHIFANNDQALKMVTWMVDYFYNRVQNVIVKYTIERHWLSLNEETGGMNDVLYRLYTITIPHEPKFEEGF